MADASTPAVPPPTVTKWWQWVLLYSGIGTTLVAGVPRVWEEYKALRLGVARSQLQLVEEQQKLWERNLPCLEHQGIWEVDGPDGLVVRVSLCRTGDVLLRYHDNEWPPVYRWVARPARKGPDDAPHDPAPAAPARRLRGSP